MNADVVPDVRYARTRDGLRIAYAISGDGPPLIFVRALNSDIRRYWSDPWVSRYFGSLAHAFSVVLFDARGNGLSDRCAKVGLDDLLEDLRAVVEDAGLDRFIVHGQGFGSPVAIAYAADEPERVSELVLYCAYARGADTVITDEFIETLRTLPGAALALMGRLTYPDVAALPRDRLDRRSFSTEPEIGAAYLEFARTVDVSAQLPRVRAPTLIVQPEHNPTIRERSGRELAGAIDGAHYVTLPVGGYNPWAEEAVVATINAISAFLGVHVQLPTMPKPKPLTVLVTDMVGSTAMRHRLGEERTHDVYRVHDGLVNEALAAHSGRQVKRTGDGIMASFAEVDDAIACAIEIQETLAARHDQGTDDALHVRIGIASGDVVEESDDLFGTTVVLAVRINDRAEAGQILVSDDVREAASDRSVIGRSRSLALKGFPERVRVHEVKWTDR